MTATESSSLLYSEYRQFHVRKTWRFPRRWRILWHARWRLAGVPRLLHKGPCEPFLNPPRQLVLPLGRDVLVPEELLDFDGDSHPVQVRPLEAQDEVGTVGILLYRQQNVVVSSKQHARKTMPTPPNLANLLNLVDW